MPTIEINYERPRQIYTEGRHIVTFPIWPSQMHTLEEGDRKVCHLLKNIFDMNTRTLRDKVYCYYDEVSRGEPEEGATYPLEGTLIVSAFYSRDAADRQNVSHLIIRRLKNFYTPLDEWMEDVKFPVGVTDYSVFAVLPCDEMALPHRVRCNPHNLILMKYPRTMLQGRGIDIDEIAEYIATARGRLKVAESEEKESTD